ncbi:hypothetical protein J6590_090952 [Homalodisca vitripennis]|nr:hypothetical protein J6590_078796 [Homalodisca vitripennis]KAG8329245.1 hypothetical protein J6590_090952 [Homalodisca vitripennis]
MRSTFITITPKSPRPSPASTCTAPPGKEEADKVEQKRSPSMTLDHNSPSTSQNTTYPPPAKKHKLSTSFRDVSLSDAVKHGTHTDVASFDKRYPGSTSSKLRTRTTSPPIILGIIRWTEQVLDIRSYEISGWLGNSSKGTGFIESFSNWGWEKQSLEI